MYERPEYHYTRGDFHAVFEVLTHRSALGTAKLIQAGLPSVCGQPLVMDPDGTTLTFTIPLERLDEAIEAIEKFGGPLTRIVDVIARDTDYAIQEAEQSQD